MSHDNYQRVSGEDLQVLPSGKSPGPFNEDHCVVNKVRHRFSKHIKNAKLFGINSTKLNYRSVF